MLLVLRVALLLFGAALCLASPKVLSPSTYIRLSHDGDYFKLYHRIPHLSIDKAFGENEAEAYVPEDELALLERFNYSYEILENRALKEAEELQVRAQRRAMARQAHTLDAPSWDDYHNYEEMTSVLHYFAETFPSLTSLFTIGQSAGTKSGSTVIKRELWVLKISTSPQEDDYTKPELHYIANMHGDEVVGRELLLRFIDRLLRGYGTDTRVTHLVDSTTIFIMPSMNPDGFEKGRRENANGFDLNRNFPDQFRGDHSSRQPETQAIMDWTLSRHFTISINFHGGACVVSYPFDGTANGRTAYSPSPDDEVIKYVSTIYASTNRPMASGRFKNGVTNGAAWYPLYGGMADWKYLNGGGDIELTVELSNTKWPSASTLQGFWEANEESLIRFFENIYTGVWGRITVGEEGCAEGEVIVSEIPKISMKTNPQGFYFRVLKPGNYRVTLKCDGYTSEPNAIEVVEGEHVEFNAAF